MPEPLYQLYKTAPRRLFQGGGSSDNRLRALDIHSTMAYELKNLMAQIWRRRRVVTMAFLVGLLWSTTARASDTHYQDYILGSRAVGLGGAYAAIASDPSATWYNPAGLPDVRRASVDISTNLYGFNSGASQLASDEQELGKTVELSFNDLNIIPASLGVAKGLGKRRKDGVFNHALAFSLLIPSMEVSSLVEERTGECLKGKGVTEFHIQRSVNDRTLWTGLGYGGRLNEWISLGMSVFYVLRSFERIDDSSSACINTSDPNSWERFNGSSTRLRFANGNIMAILGAKAKLSDRLSVGLSVGSPNLRFNSEGELSSVRSGTHDLNPPSGSPPSPSSSPHPFYVSPNFVASKSETRIPMMARVGLAYMVPKRLTAALDITYHGSTNYELFSTEAEHDEALLTIVSHVQRNQVININAGFEYLFVDEISASVGAYTNVSSAPAIPESPTGDQLPDVDMVGFTSAIGYFTEHSLVRAGLLYSYGQGHDVLPATFVPGEENEDDSPFQRVSISRNYLYFFVASTFRY